MRLSQFVAFTGFNYWVDVEFELHEAFERTAAEQDLHQVLQKLTLAMTGPQLSAWIVSELKQLRGDSELRVHLRRGDGASFRYEL